MTQNHQKTPVWFTYKVLSEADNSRAHRPLFAVANRELDMRQRLHVGNEDV
jgi:hypothetical protein